MLPIRLSDFQAVGLASCRTSDRIGSLVIDVADRLRSQREGEVTCHIRLVIVFGGTVVQIQTKTQRRSHAIYLSQL